PDHATSPTEDDVGEAAHAAPDIEHEAPANALRRPAGLLREGALRDGTACVIQLGSAMDRPLVAEVACVLIGRDEARNTVADGVPPTTVITLKSWLRGFLVDEVQVAVIAWTAQDIQQLLVNHRWCRSGHRELSSWSSESGEG